MTRSGNQAALEGARTEVLAAAREFTRAAGPIVAAALGRRVRALLETDRRARLSPELRPALDEAAARAIAAGVRGVERRLADPDVWLRPLTAPGVVTGLGELDDPGNRVWVALLAAATPLDPVLEEFGLPPDPAPNLGGGHYGLQPRTAAQLDPSGALVRTWRRYRNAYARYAALTREAPGATG